MLRRRSAWRSVAFVALAALGTAARADEASGSAVVSAVRHGVNSSDPGGTTLSLGDVLDVTLAGVDTRTYLDGSMPRVVPVINGVTLTGLVPESRWQVSNSSVGLGFRFEYRKDTAAGWAALTRELRGNGDIRSVGLDGDRPASAVTPLPLAAGALRLQIVSRLAAWLFALLYVGAIALFVWGQRNGTLLRDRGTPTAAEGESAPLATYSLARIQMAFWFFLVLGGWGYVWLLTGSHDSIPESILGLTGISMGTAFTAAMVEGKPEPTPGSTKSFFKDLLGTKDGGAMHRFQLLVWTAALGVVFLWTTARTLAMPDFSATVLGLMGFSSGTYLGLKRYE